VLWAGQLDEPAPARLPAAGPPGAGPAAQAVPRPVPPGFLPAGRPRLIYTREVIFKQVGEGRPYPDHARSAREWAAIPPRPVRLDQLITTKNVLDLHTVLAKDSTFYGDLFPHVIRWKGELYLEDGLHRALRAALHQRSVLHVRVLDLD
jgi:Arc/MetJ family transcription regulator